jgi:Meiotically up-regulated gene 113
MEELDLSAVVPLPATTVSVPGPGSVYFAQAGKSGPIKIGTARDVWTRLASLQTGSAATLHLLGVVPGGLADEKVLHQRFARHRIRGEWFKPAAALRTYITKHASMPEPARRQEPARPEEPLIPEFATTAELDAWVRSLPTEKP